MRKIDNTFSRIVGLSIVFGLLLGSCSRELIVSQLENEYGWNIFNSQYGRFSVRYPVSWDLYTSNQVSVQQLANGFNTTDPFLNQQIYNRVGMPVIEWFYLSSPETGTNIYLQIFDVSKVTDINIQEWFNDAKEEKVAFTEDVLVQANASAAVYPASFFFQPGTREQMDQTSLALINNDYIYQITLIRGVRSFMAIEGEIYKSVVSSLSFQDNQYLSIQIPEDWEEGPGLNLCDLPGEGSAPTREAIEVYSGSFIRWLDEPRLSYFVMNGFVMQDSDGNTIHVIPPKPCHIWKVREIDSYSEFKEMPNIEFGTKLSVEGVKTTDGSILPYHIVYFDNTERSSSLYQKTIITEDNDIIGTSFRFQQYQEREADKPIWLLGRPAWIREYIHHESFAQLDGFSSIPAEQLVLAKGFPFDIMAERIHVEVLYIFNPECLSKSFDSYHCPLSEIHQIYPVLNENKGIRGVVGSISDNGKTILFRTPKSGYITTSIQKNTKLLNKDGTAIAIDDIQPSRAIYVEGRGKETGILVADSIQLLSISPSEITSPPWQEMEKALISTIMPENIFPPDFSFMCEWDLLGEGKNEIYVWAVCSQMTGDDTGSSSSLPAVIKVSDSLEITDVLIPRPGLDNAVDIAAWFPHDVRIRMAEREYTDPRVMSEHIITRTNNPGMPPLIVEQSTK